MTLKILIGVLVILLIVAIAFGVYCGVGITRDLNDMEQYQKEVSSNVHDKKAGRSER